MEHKFLRTDCIIVGYDTSDLIERLPHSVPEQNEGDNTRCRIVHLGQKYLIRIFYTLTLLIRETGYKIKIYRLNF